MTDREEDFRMQMIKNRNREALEKARRRDPNFLKKKYRPPEKNQS